MSSPGRIGELVGAVRELEAWGDRRGWVGSDPYDALNATRLPAAVRRRPRLRQAVTQVVKRSPLDLRPALGVPPGRSSATLAHVVSAYARGGFLPEPETRTKLARALGQLEELRIPGYEGACWGYHFDVQTRVFFYPRGTPNTIATAFAGFALLDAFEATGEPRLLELAGEAGAFFLRCVPQTEAEGGAYFGYLPGDRTPIHNANLLVCAFLARLAARAERSELRERAEAGVSYTLAHQRPDGSWPYAERPGLEWVDGYHTGYVLESLLVCRDAGIEAARALGLERGLEHYRRALFLDDGTAKFLDRAVYPIDIQCVAQGIQTFARAARPDFAWTIFNFARRRMRRHDGSYAYQRSRLWTNPTPHVRWGAAPMLLALTYLLASARAQDEERRAA